MKKIAAVLLVLSAGILFQNLPHANEPLRIGVVDYFNSGLSSEFTRSTLAHLKEKFEPREVLIENVPLLENLSQLASTHYDFLLASPTLLISVPELQNRSIAVRAKSINGALSDLSVAGTVLVLKSRTDLNSWQDLKGKSVVATLPSDLGGWLAIMGEMKNRNLDTEKFFEKTYFIQHDIPDIFNALLNQRIDVGFVNACRLEEAAEAGLIPSGLFKVIGQKEDRGFGCVRSTDLYPDLTLIATPKCTVKDAKLAAQTVLGMKGSDSAEWISVSDFSGLNNLLRSLEIGPFSYLRDRSLSGLWRLYREWILAALLILSCLVINEFRLKRAVIRKTKQITELSRNAIELQKKLSEARTAVAKTEQKNVLTNMSALVAHELKQPLAVLSNHLSSIKLRLNELLNDDEKSADSVTAMENAAHRMNLIINRVRNYAIQDSLPHSKHDLYALIKEAVGDFKFDAPDDRTAIIYPEIPGLYVNCSSIEMRLLFLNLLKNAANALKKIYSDEPIIIKIIREKDCYCVVIENNGPAVDDDLLLKMNSNLPYLPSSTGGLGLGISLVKSISEKNNVSIVFKRRAAGGIISVVRIKKDVKNDAG